MWGLESDASGDQVIGDVYVKDQMWWLLQLTTYAFFFLLIPKDKSIERKLWSDLVWADIVYMSDDAMSTVGDCDWVYAFLKEKVKSG